MKIAILSPFYPFRGGMAQFSGRLYEELSKTNEVQLFNFTTLYPSFLFPGKTQYVTDDDSAVSVKSKRLLSSINPFSYYTTASAINKFSPDILIVPYWMSFLAPALGTVCRFIKKKTKIIGLIHNAIPHEKRFFDRPFAKYFFSQCDGFVALSNLVRDDLKAIIPQKPVLVSPHPIYDHYGNRIDRAEACLKLGVDKDKKILLFFGLIREYKGLDILIESMALLDNSYQLVIAGECYGSFQDYLASIEASPLKNNIKVMQEYIPDEKVSLLFSAADVLVLPYRDATQSGVVAVAYQMETPLIATNVGALGDSIRKASTGIVVNDVSSIALSEGIKGYFAEEETNREIFIKHIKEEKKRLSWAVFSDELTLFASRL